MEQNINDVNSPFVAGSTIDSSLNRESWKDMSTRLYSDVSNLFEKEGQLIRTELDEKLTQVKAASISFVSSGVLLFVGFLCLAATAIILLDSFMSLVAASAIVTVVFLAIGGIMFMAGKKKLEAHSLRPTRSIEAFGEIKHTLKEKMHEITRH